MLVKSIQNLSNGSRWSGTSSDDTLTSTETSTTLTTWARLKRPATVKEAEAAVFYSKNKLVGDGETPAIRRKNSDVYINVEFQQLEGKKWIAITIDRNQRTTTSTRLKLANDSSPQLNIHVSETKNQTKDEEGETFFVLFFDFLKSQTYLMLVSSLRSCVWLCVWRWSSPDMVSLEEGPAGQGRRDAWWGAGCWVVSLGWARWKLLVWGRLVLLVAFGTRYSDELVELVFPGEFQAEMGSLDG